MFDDRQKNLHIYYTVQNMILFLYKFSFSQLTALLPSILRNKIWALDFSRNDKTPIDDLTHGFDFKTPVY